MLSVITGGCKNGKSSLAQDMAVALAGGGSHYYIATMIPTDDEDLTRIAKHLADRDGLGFETIECGRHITDALKVSGGRGSYLLDSVTALLANEMFPGPEIDREAGPRVMEELLRFADEAEHAVLVFDGLFSDAAEFDETTENYRHWLAMLQGELIKKSEIAVEMCAGVPVYLKGSEALWRKMAAAASPNEKGAADQSWSGGREGGSDRRSGIERGEIMEVVIGGAYQGKVGYVKEKYGLRDDEIAVCPKDGLPDLTRRCLNHVENYVLYALREGSEPDLPLREDQILIFDDFFCGVVPIDKEMRLWREAAARYMTSCAKRACRVTRVVANIPQCLKGEGISDAPGETGGLSGGLTDAARGPEGRR